MGNFEKLVVLAVLFLSAIVLAVSLNDGKSDEERLGAPLEAARSDEVRAAEPKPDEPADDGPDFLLSTELSRASEEGAAELDDAIDGPLEGGRILRSTQGLESAGIADYMVYTVEPGDTWAGLSERYYRTSRYVHLLRTANEEVQRLVTGERILVPVYDFAQDAGVREPFRAVAGRDEAQPRASLAAAVSDVQGGERSADAEPVGEPTASAIDYTQAELYEVQPGDNLSGISKKVYGTSSRWKLIYDANRHKLESPDWLQVGMQIAIPRGELPALRPAPSATEEETEKPQGNVVR